MRTTGKIRSFLISLTWAFWGAIALTALFALIFVISITLAFALLFVACGS